MMYHCIVIARQKSVWVTDIGEVLLHPSWQIFSSSIEVVRTTRAIHLLQYVGRMEIRPTDDMDMCVGECVIAKEQKERNIWPGFVFTRCWTHQGNLCCQVCFPPKQTFTLSYISPAALQRCLLQCLLFSYQQLSIPAFSFKLWFLISRVSVIKLQARRTKFGLTVCCIRWPLDVASWLGLKSYSATLHNKTTALEYH